MCCRSSDLLLLEDFPNSSVKVQGPVPHSQWLLAEPPLCNDFFFAVTCFMHMTLAC